MSNASSFCESMQFWGAKHNAVQSLH